jgi:hypothetical protein
LRAFHTQYGTLLPRRMAARPISVVRHNAKRAGKALPRRIWHHDSAFDLRNPEVPAEMEEIEWTDRPGNHDKVDVIRPGNQNRNVANGIIF